MTKNINYKFKAILIGFAVLIILLFLVTNIADNRENNNRSVAEESEALYFSDDPKSELGIYYKIRDSILKITNWRKNRIIGHGSSTNSLVFGIMEINECDSCYSNDDRKYQSQYKDKFFIRFNGFTLRTYADFYIDKDKYFVKSAELGLSKEISVRYSPGYPSSYKSSAVMIPISKKTYETLEIIVWGLLIVFFLVFLYIIYILPAKVLMAVASGEPFTKKNIKRLNITGLTLLAVAIVPPLISIFVDWIMGNRIPDDIYFPFIHVIFDNKYILVAGLVVLLIANAFKQGYNLQQEQDLTI